MVRARSVSKTSKTSMDLDQALTVFLVPQNGRFLSVPFT
jgi:hypothetical protein